MLIPPSQEFDPGTRQNYNGQIVMTTGHTMATSLEAPPLAPHRYQYPIDVPRIHRLLRPLKAKVKAIQLAIKSAPSYGYTSNTNNNNNNSTTSSNNNNNNNINRTANTNRTSRHERYLNRSGQTHSWEQGESSRSRRERTNHYYGRRTTSSAPIFNGDTPATLNTSVKSGRDLLIRRFQHSLTDVFRELIDKNWWQPICDDYDLPLNSSLSKVMSMGIKPSEYSLGMTCAFAVGRFVAGLSEDEEDLVDRYYNVMPESMRRFALLEHAVGICTSQVPIKDILIPLVEVCARYRADAQALRILEHLLMNQDDTFQLDYRWAYIVASRIASADSWVQTWAQKAPVSFFTSRLFSAITLQLPHHGATLIQASIKVHMDSTTTGISMKTRRARSVKFATSLIEESLKLHERLTDAQESMLPTSILSRHEKYDGEIERLARSLFEEHEMEPGSWQKGVALALALHSLYATVTTSPESTTAYDGMSSWVELIENRAAAGICAGDFDVVVQAYGTLPNLNSLALMLDAVGLYSLAMTLIDVMLTDFYILEDTTCRSLRNSCDVTIQSLEALQKEVGQRRIKHDCEVGWVYDDVMETWVETTPKSSKALALPIDTFIETDGYESEDEEHDAYPTTPTRRRGNSAPGSTSRDVFSESSQSHADNPTSSPTRHSPFVMRRPIRYSMTPVRRTTKPRQRLGRYSEDGSEPETGQDDDEGVYVAPVDLEFYARYAIEDDSDNEDQLQRDLRSSAGSDSGDNFSENTAPNSWSSRSSNASSDGDAEDGDGSASEDALHGDDEEALEQGSEREVVTRSSRRRGQDDHYSSPMTPTVIVLSDGTDSDADGSFGEADADIFTTSDDDNEQSNSDGSESGVMVTVRTSRHHQESESMEEDDSENMFDDISGEEVYVISDDDVEPNDKSGEELSQESDPQPNYGRRPSQQRQALNTPESEPDTDTSGYCDEPVIQRETTRRIQSRHNVAKQGKYRSPSPLPSPPREPRVAPSRIRLRKTRPQNYAFFASEGSLSDESTESDYQQSVKKQQSKSRSSRSSRPLTSRLRPTPAPKHLRDASISKARRMSNGHRSTQEVPDSNEESESSGPPYKPAFKSRSASTNGIQLSTSRTNQGTTPGYHALNRRKRPINYDDDTDARSDNKHDDYSGEDVDDQLYVSPRSDSDAVLFKSAPRASKSQEKRQVRRSIRIPSESSGSDSPPGTRTRRRVSSSQPRARKRIRIHDDDDASEVPDKTSDSNHIASSRKVSKRSKENRRVSSIANSRVIVAEDSLDEMDDFQQEPHKSGRSWANTTQTYTQRKLRSTSASTSTSTSNLGQSKATRTKERLFWL
ncbi:hypothetical protein BGW39_010873 [Mortierella sp. 14UC]|nr:hypothetical protein BGW39_010873 [Mortierella sp. 14UC]